MNQILKPNLLCKLRYCVYGISHPLLLCCFTVCLMVTANLIAVNSNNVFAKQMDSLSIYNDNSTPGMINLDSVYADAESVGSLSAIDKTLVKAHVNYEQKLADLAFALQQYEMMELQTFNFVIEVSDREKATSMMLKHLQKMLAEFTRSNPDIKANWQVDPNDAFKLTVHLNTERQREWGSLGFII